MVLPSPHKTGYLDCFSGVSGDMLLGALIHAGLDQQILTQELAKLDIKGLILQVEETHVHTIRGFKVHIRGKDGQQYQTLPDIVHLLKKSKLDAQIITRASEVFLALAKAEARVHGLPVDEVHFHEVGAIDAIVDVVGTVIGLHHLNINKLVCSPMPMGHGFVKCAHGLLPLPAPAVCELLRGIPTYGIELQQEIVTPTGAALIASLADSFGPLPPLAITAIGYGAGSHILTNGQPNLLRLIVGEAADLSETQEVEIIETNLDDWSPESFPYLCERLFDQGALDVTLTPVQMKKGRPGFTLQVISSPLASHHLKDIVLSETTAIGLRFRKESRRTLIREMIMVETEWGKIEAKKIDTPAGTIIHPEYERCRKIAHRHQVPLQQVYSAVRKGTVSP